MCQGWEPGGSEGLPSTDTMWGTVWGTQAKRCHLQGHQKGAIQATLWESSQSQSLGSIRLQGSKPFKICRPAGLNCFQSGQFLNISGDTEKSLKGL